MDVIALHRAGFTNAIASLGTALTEEQARIIRRYADEAVICYDSDEGRAAGHPAGHPHPEEGGAAGAGGHRAGQQGPGRVFPLRPPGRAGAVPPAAGAERQRHRVPAGHPAGKARPLHRRREKALPPRGGGAGAGLPGGPHGAGPVRRQAQRGDRRGQGEHFGLRQTGGGVPGPAAPAGRSSAPSSRWRPPARWPTRTRASTCGPPWRRRGSSPTFSATRTGREPSGRPCPRKTSSPSGGAEYTFCYWARLNRAKSPSPTWRGISPGRSFPSFPGPGGAPDAPPTWEDVEDFQNILRRGGGFFQPPGDPGGLAGGPAALSGTAAQSKVRGNPLE